jgi:serine/threonine protein kinase
MARVVFGPQPNKEETGEAAGEESDRQPTRADCAPEDSKAGDLTGQKIGRYKLLEQIGEGGFGVVYMAEQLEPIQRKVAFKIIKAGMDTRAVIARFEAERQALALMDHPNIAKVLDAGATEAGRPYFVMDLVRGLPITAYCDNRHLSPRERLQLFIAVCQAVQHAHQKGIIHRDIKPSNVLITLHDGVPVPKVIDFGIAKALGQKLTDKTLFTGFAQLMGTPAYMSPEQAEFSGLDADTRSDIYSLGVLLYELLTSHTPFDPQRMIKAGLDEVRRIIREEDPVQPSTRISALEPAEQTTMAKARQIELPKLVRLIRGDLDWIVMKCLEKNRTRRYETANGLAADISRHLNNEPVVARPPSRLYEFQKSVRRHKFGFAAAAAVITVLVAGVIVSTFEAIRARRAEREQTQLRQEAEAARANEARLRQQIEVRLTVAQARTLSNSGKYDEAENLLNGIEPSLIEPDAIHADLRRQLGWQRILKYQWSGAAANLAVLLQVDGKAWDHEIASDYHWFATAIVEAGDQAGYERFRQALVKSSIGTAESKGADFICWISLLAPADEKLIADLGSRYDTESKPQAFTGDRAQDDMSYNYLHRAIVDFRRGNYSKADELIQHCGSQLKDPTIVPTALAIRAMIHHQMHRDDEARNELESARSAIDPIIQTGPSDFNAQRGRYYEWVQADILLREAEVLIEGQPSPRLPMEYRLRITEARNLFDAGQPEEAEQALDKIRPEIFEPVRQQVAARRLLGWEYAREHHWANAVSNLAVVVQNDNPHWNSETAEDHVRYSAAAVIANDLVAYNHYRQNLVADLFHTNNAEGAWFLCRLALLTPADPAFMRSLEPFVKVAFTTTNFSVAPSPSHSYKAYHTWMLALAAYRNGDYPNAMALTAASLDQHPSDRALVSFIHSTRAMALCRMGRVQEAKHELDQAKEPVDPIFKNGVSKVTDDSQWLAWHIAQIYINEAEKMTSEPAIPNSGTNRASQ